jgi:hypothetical protein
MTPAQPRIALVTGADAKFVLMAGALFRSLRDAGWTGSFHICDFGLTDRQAAAFGDAGLLLPRPRRLAAGLHPFYYKASLVDYVAGLDFDLLVWIDCDMIAVDDPAAALNGLAAAMRHVGKPVAICADAGAGSIAEACDRLPMQPFRDTMMRSGLGDRLAYLNTGLVAIGDRSLLAAWQELAFAMPPHMRFEQNAFNFLFHSRRLPAVLLPAERWNVHGALLAAAQVSPSGAVDIGGTRAFLLHATSPDLSQHEVFQGPVTLLGGVFHGQLKLFRNPGLRRLQGTALNAWSLDPLARLCAPTGDGV